MEGTREREKDSFQGTKFTQLLVSLKSVGQIGRLETQVGLDATGLRQNFSLGKSLVQ